MDQQTLLILMTVFVAISGIALLVQAAMLAGLYVTSKKTQRRVEEVLPRINTLLEGAQTTLEQSQRQIGEIGLRANQVLDTTKVQLARVDEFLADASTRAKIQMDRAELVLDDAMSRTQETVALVHRGVTAPVREAHALAAGVKSAVTHFFQARKPSVANATADEEMFI